jgi:hypothetical protein
MAIPGGTVSFADIQREFGGNDPIAISEYWRDPSDWVESSSYVKTKSPYGDHPNTTNIPTPGQIDLAQFRNSYSLLGFNRYYTGVYVFTLHFYTSNPGGEFLGAPNYYNLENQNYFYIHGGPVFPGTVPLLRYFKGSQANGAGGPHLFTTSQAEGDNARDNLGFNEEGKVGYVYTYQAPNTQPIYRGTSNEGNFLYTYRQDEIDNAGYQYNGPAFYAFTSTNWW